MKISKLTNVKTLSELYIPKTDFTYVYICITTYGYVDM